MKEKKYPVPTGKGFEIIAMMKFKTKTSMMIESDEVWQYDPKTQGFLNREFSFRAEIEADENEFFPVYDKTPNSVFIFIWEKTAGLGIFVEIHASLIGKIVTKATSIPFSRN